MTYTINNECAACGACYDECLPEAIKPGTTTYSIDADFCDECEACLDVCPVAAIVSD